MATRGRRLKTNMNMARNKQLLLSTYCLRLFSVILLCFHSCIYHDIQMHASRYSKRWFISLPVIEKAFLSCSHGNVCFEGYKSISPKGQCFVFFLSYPPLVTSFKKNKKNNNIPTMRNSRQPSLFVENHYTI